MTDAAAADPLASEPQSGPPITRPRTLHDEVVMRVRDMIIEGRLAPGQRVNEVAIGKQLGVSRTPLREAIKTLMGEGLIVIVPARGAVVRAFTIADVRDTLEAIKAIEQFAGQRACESASDAEIARIGALHEAMLALYRKRERLEYFKLNQAIHTAIVRASGNEVLAVTHDALQARIRRIRFLGNEAPEKWAGAVAEHEDMMAALRRRDGAALAAVLGQHMDNTLVRVGDLPPPEA
jgi:DNA-binding GntR family transcriptional regulator